MAVYETEALILRNYSLADADKIVVFLTRSFGIVKCVAKGAKKLNSRFGSLLEPFTTVDLTYFLKDDHDLASIREIELRSSVYDTTAYPEVLKTLSYFGRLLMEFVPPNEPGEKTFRMATACVQAIAEDRENLDQVTLYFEAWLLRLAGFLPDWSKCAECEKVFEENDNAVMEYSFHLSHLLCQPHRKEPKITARQRALMTQIRATAPKDFAAQTASEKKECRELSFSLQSIISHVLGKDIENGKYILPEEIMAEAANGK